MAMNYSRKEIHFPREIAHKLELLRQSVKEETGKSISMNQLVVEIVKMFFDKTPDLFACTNREKD
jgi:hypothetical protein